MRYFLLSAAVQLSTFTLYKSKLPKSRLFLGFRSDVSDQSVLVWYDAVLLGKSVSGVSRQPVGLGLFDP